jgi:hypothetical protein
MFAPNLMHRTGGVSKKRTASFRARLENPRGRGVLPLFPSGKVPEPRLSKLDLRQANRPVNTHGLTRYFILSSSFLAPSPDGGMRQGRDETKERHVRAPKARSHSSPGQSPP